MKEQPAAVQNSEGLKPCLSPLVVWALSVGSAIGWGSLVVTSSSYLSQAGPKGSILGLLVGFAMMVMMCSHYHFLANRYPGTGGLYDYVKNIFGYDQAFFVGWFMFLTYIAIFWANATSIPLFARYFLNNVFGFGYLYTIFGYKVYLGEVIVTMLCIILTGILCMKSKKATSDTIVIFVLIFTVGITVCFAAAMAGHRSTGMTMGPAFLPDKSALEQVFHIAFLTPWAFIGFETVTHYAAEYKFKHSRLFRIMFTAVIVTTALYIFVILLSVSAYPEGCSSWIDYIMHLDQFEGIAGLPAFYAAHYYLGDTGVYILMASLAALVFSSLIGIMRAVSRLCFAVTQDGILPAKFKSLNENQIPVSAIFLVVLVSLPIPLVGRTAIGWIVDTTTFGATILYGFAALAVYKVAKQEGSRKDIILSGICIPILVFFLAFLFLPNLFFVSMIASETYALMVAWSVLGVIYFNAVIRKDHDRKFGKAVLVWVSLIAFIVILALTWTSRMNETNVKTVIENIISYFDNAADTALTMGREEFIAAQQNILLRTDRISFLTIAGLFVLSLGVMVANFSSVRRWEKQAAEERDHARIAAFTDSLTGVKSKTAFAASEKEYDTMIADGIAGDFAVAVCDVNNLKNVNDTLGHKAGDEYIRQASRTICDIFQHSPVYRIGGDEFAVIMSGRDYIIRKELLLTLHDRSVEHISKGGVIISGGYSDFIQAEDSSFHDVFERADALMYEEKQLLKSLGAATRDAAEEPDNSAVAMGNHINGLSEKRSILIVEDEDINLMLLGNMLENGDYNLLYASDGSEALEQIRKHKDEIAIVLLDLQMPHMSGMDVLKVMKEESELAGIPVIVMTADQSAEVECLKVGAMDFIPKPYPSPEIVQARVTRCIELSEKREIIQSTERDPITGLYNMSYFQNYVRMYDRHYMDMPMDAIVIDINHFHMLNERYGKQYGDGVLSQIGKQIRAISREVGGVSCRETADTFFIYCPHRDDYEKILAMASEGSGGKEASSDRVRLRMGVYANVDKELEIERRFDYAKNAANTVKDGFRKAIGIYDDEMHKAELFRERLLEDFRKSLAENRFQVYFQPKYDIRSDKPVLSSAEALVRWNHPELGFISPGVFIPLLEDNGMIQELDLFVWRGAAAQIRDWKDRFGYSVPVSVNVSRVDMLTPNLKDIFSDILKAFSLDAGDLMLEITESAYTEDAEQVISTAEELRGIGMGFRIEMDDFGTGYSSLGMLSHLPVDVLKLDMSFVRSAFGETRDLRMIELIIDIADYLNVPVVAEGVETEEQYQVLKAMGCDYVQGYYFSKPVPPEEFDRFLIERGKKGVEIGPSVRRTSMSISNALTGDFERVFYIDVISAHFLEFFSDKDGNLEIRPGGTDFFGDAGEKLLDDVCEEDRERLREVLSKTNLIRWISEEGTNEVSFRRMQDGELKPYILQTIKTRSSDDHHIVIGMRLE